MFNSYFREMRELIALGILVIFIGMILVFVGALSSIRAGEAKTRVAVGGFIGFIPFGFASDRKMLYLVIGLSAFMFLFFAIMSYLWR